MNNTQMIIDVWPHNNQYSIQGKNYTKSTTDATGGINFDLYIITVFILA